MLDFRISLIDRIRGLSLDLVLKTLVFLKDVDAVFLRTLDFGFSIG